MWPFLQYFFSWYAKVKRWDIMYTSSTYWIHSISFRFTVWKTFHSKSTINRLVMAGHLFLYNIWSQKRYAVFIVSSGTNDVVCKISDVVICHSAFSRYARIKRCDSLAPFFEIWMVSMISVKYSDFFCCVQLPCAKISF